MEEMQFCHSCAAPLGMPDFKGPLDYYCKYCAGEDGKLKSRQEVQMGIAQWMKTWQPDVDDDLAMQRAAHYMKAMPHWA